MSCARAASFAAASSPIRAQAEGRARIRGRRAAKPRGRGPTQSYDDLGRLTSRCYEYEGQSARCYTAQYDAVGNPVRMTDPDGADTLEYDALDRLTKVTRVAGGVTTVEDYAYNALGAVKVNAGVTLDDQRPRLAGGGTANAAVPASAGGIPIALDAGGRVTSLRGATFTWTRDGTLREAAPPIPGVAETYGVDSRGRRYSRLLGGAVQEYYVYEGLDRIAIMGPNGPGVPGPVLESYLFDGIDHPLRIKRGSTTAYYELDLAGNVRALRASGGADLGAYRYSAFGKTVEDTTTLSQPLRWKGRWYSPLAGGIYDVRARQWSPELGVFLSVDEFEYQDAKSTLWGWPKQNPVRFGDPDGHGFLCSASCGAGYLVCLTVADHDICTKLFIMCYLECEDEHKYPNPPPGPPNIGPCGGGGGFPKPFGGGGPGGGGPGGGGSGGGGSSDDW